MNYVISAENYDPVFCTPYEKDTPIFVVITPTRTRWMFVDDNKETPSGRK